MNIHNIDYFSVPTFSPDNLFRAKADTPDAQNASLPRHVMYGVGSVDSSFFIRFADGINKWDHPNLPALMLYCQILTQLEVCQTDLCEVSSYHEVFTDTTAVVLRRETKIAGISYLDLLSGSHVA